MGDFSSTSKFRVSMLDNEGGPSERVTVQLGLDGLKISDASSGRTLRNFELGHISRWSSRGNQLILYTRTPVDVEERQLTLQGDDYTIRSVLDTLTCSCLQLAELLQSKESSDARDTANNLHALVAGDGKKKTKLPSADDVEYWKEPVMEGWLQCQGEVLKSWRKRWFVLKQGHLFRFMNASVTESSKPRGVVDLSKIQDVSQATKTTGKAFSFQLKTAAGGSVAYLCDSETDLVMWMSAINREVERIVKRLAGVDDEPAPSKAAAVTAGSRSSNARSGGSRGEGGGGASQEWMRQLEKNFDALSTTSTGAGGGGAAGGGGVSIGRSSGSSRAQRGRGGDSKPAMVDVVGYETIGGGGGGNGAGGGGSSRYGGGGGGGGGAYGGGGSSGLGYGNIAGAAGVASGGLSADTLANYGGIPVVGGNGGGGGYGDSYTQQQQQQPPQQQQHQAYGGYGNGAYGNGGYGNGGYGGAASGGYGGAEYVPQQQQQQQPSLIDQVPSSQPAYPYYQQGMPQATGGMPSAGVPQQAAATMHQAVAPGAGGGGQWQVHHTPEGRPYYYNTSTGTTQWEAPQGGM